jgi:ribosomal protein S18 acetylase RimI-like enzyme
MNQDLTIAVVRTDSDSEAVRTLCLDFLQWNRARYSHLEWLIERYYDPSNWAAYLSRLTSLYAPPLGDILLARLGAEAVGCVMMQPVEPRTCEMKHLFVSGIARGRQVGFRLCELLMMLAAQRGFQRMYLETGIENNEAIALYTRLGFRPREPSSDYPEAVRDLLQFMSADLAGWAPAS